MISQIKNLSESKLWQSRQQQRIAANPVKNTQMRSREHDEARTRNIQMNANDIYIYHYFAASHCSFGPEDRATVHVAAQRFGALYRFQYGLQLHSPKP